MSLDNLKAIAADVIISEISKQSLKSHVEIDYWMTGLIETIEEMNGEPETKRLIAKKLFEQLLERIT